MDARWDPARRHLMLPLWTGVHSNASFTRLNGDLPAFGFDRSTTDDGFCASSSPSGCRGPEYTRVYASVDQVAYVF